MAITSEEFYFEEVSPADAAEKGICCSKDRKSKGFNAKVSWMCKPENDGLRLILAGRPQAGIIGFAEYLPADAAWRPVLAENYMFIQCIAMYEKKSRNQGVAGAMLGLIEKKALELGMNGVCVMTSTGSWMADKSLFEKNGYQVCDALGRFELLCKTYNPEASLPELIDQTEALAQYQGWHLVYADQCPWHQKAVNDLLEAATENNIQLKVTLLETAAQARNSPTGFGTFGLIKDGKLLADHYISKTRFLNILKKGK